MTHSQPHTALAWREISDGAPKGSKIIVAYRNEAGNWRRVMAKFYPAGSLDASEDCLDAGTDQDGFAPEGWYEDAEAYEPLLPLERAPEYWMPLPSQPGTEPPHSINTNELLEAAKEYRKVAWPWIDKHTGSPRLTQAEWEAVCDRLEVAISNAEKASSIAKAEREMGDG